VSEEPTESPADAPGERARSGVDSSGGGTGAGGADTPLRELSFGPARARVVDALVAFVGALRDEGVRVPADGSVAAARALAVTGFDDRRRVRAALRATLVSEPADLRAFERLFPGFWRRLVGATGGDDGSGWTPPQQDEPPGSEIGATAPGPDSGAAPDDRGEDGSDPSAGIAEVRSAGGGSRAVDVDVDGDDGTGTAVYSPVGRPERVAMPRATDPDGELERAVARLGGILGEDRGRRFARGGNARVDPRRVLRESLATGGVAASLPERERERSALQAVVLVDVSRSVLDAIDRRFLLAFLAAARREWRGVRAFFFDTGLREVTDAFDAGAARGALDRVEAEWGGGTRIGDALERLRRGHPDAVSRGTVVLVVSDGLEVGGIDDLERGMAWLSRRAPAVLWLNPLAASPEYEPTCRGMAASLPYVDGLFAFAGPGDVAEMARQLDRHGVGGPVGYRHDPRRMGDADAGTADD